MNLPAVAVVVEAAMFLCSAAYISTYSLTFKKAFHPTHKGLCVEHISQLNLVSLDSVLLSKVFE